MKRLAGFIFICFGVGVFALHLYIQNYQEQKVLNTTDKTFQVEQGESLYSVGRKLETQGIVPNATIFVKVGQLEGYQDIRFGEYIIKAGASIGSIYNQLIDGSVLKYEIVFTEGSHRFDLANQLEAKHLASKSEILSLITNKNFIRSLLGDPLDSLEGYLFPDTYHFSKTDGAKVILTTMVNRFIEVYKEVQSKAALGRHELVTLASIIEKETGAGFERAKISSVFYNRMRKGMRLQTDPTVIYGKLIETGIEPKNITRKDLKTRTPYNTYVIKGLPPGPIGNPGEEALKAAFQPEKTDYLYFVSQNDGTHIFTTNYEAHKAAVKKFQLNPSMRKGKSWRDLKKNQQKQVN